MNIFCSSACYLIVDFINKKCKMGNYSVDFEDDDDINCDELEEKVTSDADIATGFLMTCRWRPFTPESRFYDPTSVTRVYGLFTISDLQESKYKSKNLYGLGVSLKTC